MFDWHWVKQTFTVTDKTIITIMSRPKIGTFPFLIKFLINSFRPDCGECQCFCLWPEKFRQEILNYFTREGRDHFQMPGDSLWKGDFLLIALSSSPPPAQPCTPWSASAWCRRGGGPSSTPRRWWWRSDSLETRFLTPRSRRLSGLVLSAARHRL